LPAISSSVFKWDQSWEFSSTEAIEVIDEKTSEYNYFAAIGFAGYDYACVA
jgi:hypothetical protein